MFKSLFAVACSALLINNVFGASNSNQVCQLNNPDVDVNTQFNLCLDGKYYQCYEKSNGNNNNNNNNNNANTSTLSVNTNNSNSGSGNNNNNNNLFSISYYNLNNLLKKADCYHVSNNCRRNQRFLALDCTSNYSTSNTSVSSSGSSTNSSSSNGCVLTSSSTSNHNSTELRCKVLFNLTKKDYLYAFIAVIVLILFFFCVCPICCVYYYCRHYDGNKMEHNSMFNGYNKKNKNEKCGKGKEKEKKENEKNKYNTTMGGDTTNNNYDGDMTYEQNENNENNALCGKRKMTSCMSTTEQEIETQPIYNTSNQECNNEKDGTNTRDEVVV